MNQLNIPGLPVIQLTQFEYNEETSELTIDIAPSDTLNAYVGAALGQETTATHEEMEKFFVEIIVKALERRDGYNFQHNQEEESAKIV